MSTELWILIGIIVLAVFIVLIVFAKRESEREYREQKEKEKEELEETTKKLKKHSFVVVIRERDQRKTCFESIFIGQLVTHGVKVIALKEDEAKKLLKGDFNPIPQDTKALIGTTWTWKDDSPFNYSKTGLYCHRSLDYRLIEPSNKILLASFDHDAEYNENKLILQVIKKVARTLEPD